MRLNYEYQIVWIRFIGTYAEDGEIKPTKFKEMEIKLIKTEQDYNQALKRLKFIFDAKKGTKEGDELEVLGILIEKYKDDYFPIDLPDPNEAVKFRMEQMDYSQNDLAKMLGLKSRVSEILNKKRKLSLEMICKLHTIMKIPTEVLIQAF